MKNGSLPELGQNDFRLYYLHDDTGCRFACVAVAPGSEDGRVHRGISICSERDTFNKKLARCIALGRLQLALKGQRVGPIQNQEHLSVYLFQKYFEASGIVYKSDYNTTPTEKEVYLLKKMQEVKERSNGSTASV